MVAAAEQLMRNRGTDEFTLTEVCKLGKVSMGSIYHQFESKDDLIHAVQDKMLLNLGVAQREMIERSVEGAKNLPELLSNLVEGIGESLREHAPILRPIMLRSATDERVWQTGTSAYSSVAALVDQAILARRDEISHPNPEHAVSAAFSIAYAALARFLGLGTPGSSNGDLMEWHALKQDLSFMCLAFLTPTPATVTGLR